MDSYKILCNKIEDELELEFQKRKKIGQKNYRNVLLGYQLSDEYTFLKEEVEIKLSKEELSDDL